MYPGEVQHELFRKTLTVERNYLRIQYNTAMHEYNVLNPTNSYAHVDISLL